MRETKHAPKGKRSKKALSVVLSVAGMSLAATAAGPVASMTLPATAPLQPVPLGEEEITDVSLATFHLFDQEKLGAPGTIMELVRGGGCGGCGHGGGCGGCGHGGGFGGGCGHGGGFGGGCGHGGGFGGCGMRGLAAVECADSADCADAVDVAEDADGADAADGGADAAGVCPGVVAIPGAKQSAPLTSIEIVNIDQFAKMTGIGFHIESPVGQFATGCGAIPEGF